MKIRFILSHPGSQLFGEVREAMIARDLAQHGHDAQIYRIQARADEKQDWFRDSVPVRYFPADDVSVGPHRTVSGALREAVLADPPDIVVFKGLGYDVVSHVLESIPQGAARIGFILGGSAVDPQLSRADFVLAESEGQISQIRTAVSRPLPCTTLAKYIDWETADRVHAERQAAGVARHDIVNVGSFEPRKNQMALQAFFGRYRVAFVGAGEMLAPVTEAASGHADVTLFGAKTNAETLGIVAHSRLMVHASVWEGVPRAVFESLACGTPVVAHGFAIQEKFDGTSAVRLVAEGELVLTAETLLGNPSLLAAMGEEGRIFARERHGPHRLAEAAGRILGMAGTS